MPAASEFDSLFTLPLEEFTAARNALADRLKKAGAVDDAQRIKRLAKPSLSAWAVNQLYWTQRKAFERLLAGGDRLRKAQAAQLSGKRADLRAPLEERRKSLDELLRLASAVLEQAGHAANADTLRRVTTTLEALTAYGTEGPEPGRLTDDVSAPGFEALASLVPRGGRNKTDTSPSRVIPFQQRSPRGKDRAKTRGADIDPKAKEAERKAAVRQATAAVTEAERALRESRQAAQRAQALLKGAAADARRVPVLTASSSRSPGAGPRRGT